MHLQGSHLDIYQLLVPTQKKGCDDLRTLFIQGWVVVRAALGTNQGRCHI